MADIRDYERLARESGAYRDIELDILVESLQLWSKSPGAPNTLLELRDGKILAGFALLCRAMNTDFTFDVLALCVARSYHGTEAGRSLIAMVEEEALRASDSVIVRVETSSRKESAIQQGLLAQEGYALIGHIADFYEAGDDYFIYAKHLAGERAGSGEGETGEANGGEGEPQGQDGAAPGGTTDARSEG